MLTGKLRYWVVAAVLLSGAISPPVSAEDGPIDDCALVSDIAELIMRERQHGATMHDLVLIERQLPPSLHGLVEIASIESFRFPQRDTEEERTRAVQDFRLLMLSYFCPPEAK